MSVEKTQNSNAWCELIHAFLRFLELQVIVAKISQSAWNS